MVQFITYKDSQQYIMEDNKIFNLDIKKKKIHLQLDMAEGANHALKFVYVLEVAS